MKLAREFCRPDWRAMLAGMSSTELESWADFYRSDNYFHDTLIDTHFSRLSHLMLSIHCKNDCSPTDFSLLNPVALDIDMDDEQMMSLAESIPGGVRYGPVSG
ncbi:phage tail assembly protein T [Gibbsiella quercinecans]|uniref:phage tail assembly protein T n=1 Tax=Gibbsiella quercinecans TaxID=929813 RepID=UPI000EF17A0D|nr:phage tail assembly protein T [Gibbsiella quercinecans]RLM13315.1 phage tail assembly protein T [Gibbsiella quercinecans]